MCGAALHLPVHDHRIDDGPAVVRDGVPAERDAAGHRIDLDLHHMRAVAIGRLRRDEIGGVLEPDALAVGERHAGHALREPRQFAKRQ